VKNDDAPGCALPGGDSVARSWGSANFARARTERATHPADGRPGDRSGSARGVVPPLGVGGADAIAPTGGGLGRVVDHHVEDGTGAARCAPTRCWIVIGGFAGGEPVCASVTRADTWVCPYRRWVVWPWLTMSSGAGRAQDGDNVGWAGSPTARPVSGRGSATDGHPPGRQIPSPAGGPTLSGHAGPVRDAPIIAHQHDLRNASPLPVAAWEARLIMSLGADRAQHAAPLQRGGLWTCWL
jgi:hypothetical protein